MLRLQVVHGVTKLHSGVRYSLFVVDVSNGLGQKDVHHLKFLKVNAIARISHAAREAAENAAVAFEASKTTATETAANFKTTSTVLEEAMAETIVSKAAMFQKAAMLQFNIEKITRDEARTALDESGGDVIIAGNKLLRILVRRTKKVTRIRFLSSELEEQKSVMEEAQKRVGEIQEQLKIELAQKDESGTQEEESKGGK